ncbi:MAG: hypothetical protein KI786_02200 [Mameliella sp.]|nr:hypothetical protein [Phaeodactylibacter sp.]
MLFPELSRDFPESLGPTKWFFKGLRRRFTIKREQKIFVISMGKTGTTSIAKGLNRLGYKVSGAFYDLSNNRTYTYDSLFQEAQDLIPYYDVFQDTPWFLFYKDIAEKYCNAKFIFIERDSISWYKSFSRHQGGKPRYLWKFIYGVDDVSLDPNRVIEAYEKHSVEVKEYFKTEQDRILFIKINELCYNRICSFLNIKNVPVEEFPHSNQAKVRGSLELRFKRTLKSLWKRKL